MLRTATSDGVEVLTLPSGAGVRRTGRPALPPRPCAAVDSRRRVPDRQPGAGRHAVPALRRATRHRGRGGPVPARAGEPVPDPAGGLLQRAHLAGRPARGRSDRIAIGGASAGGGLTAALAFLARDRGDVTLLSHPMLDDRHHRPGPRRARIPGCGTPPATGSAGPPIWAARIPRWRCRPGAPISAARRRPGLGSEHWTSSHDEDLAYAARLNAAGVPCEVHEVPGASTASTASRPRHRSRRLISTARAPV